MRRKKNLKPTAIITVWLLILAVPALAGKETDELKKQIETLQKRVTELEAAQSKPQENTSPYSRFPTPSGGWDPFEEMDRMQEEMNKMFQNSYQGQGPSNKGSFNSSLLYEENLDIKETEEGYVIRFDIAGLDKDKINIDINEHSITVSGEQSTQTEESSENRRFQSHSFGSFLKTIPLPVDADTAKVETKKEGDVMVIKMPRKK